MSVGKQIDKPLTVVIGFRGATLNTLFSEISKFPPGTVDYVGTLDRGAIIKKGLLDWSSPEEYVFIKGKAATLAFLYFHIIQYSGGFIGRSLQFKNYFEPLNNWEI